MHLIALPLVAQLYAQIQIAPVLAFPEPGLDDTAAYQGYQTRFFRDVRGNTVQIYLDRQSGRVVAVWGDAANESIGFTVRDAAGNPIALEWGGPGATIGTAGGLRTLTVRLSADAPRVRIGLFALGTMRAERDIQYAGAHRGELDEPLAPLAELTALVDRLERLPAAERRRQLALLRASGIEELRARLHPRLTVSRSANRQAVRITQAALDAGTRLSLTIAADPRRAALTVDEQVIALESRGGMTVPFQVTIGSDAPSLTPLTRGQIFDRQFLQFLAAARRQADSVSAGGGPLSSRDSGTVTRARWLERQVRSVEVLASREKLMAGMPNFATYFGRDMMMAALMMQPVWTPEMAELVIASVLRKLSSDGQVSHEEALGGQAIRESAAEYVALIDRFLAADSGATATRDSLLRRARAVLQSAARTRENYHMRDDEFHLPVLVARWLADDRVTASRKRAFLLAADSAGRSRLSSLLRELALVAELSAPYAADPRPASLIAFPERAPGLHFPGSWRDSNAGYGNGRYAMDINAIWVPEALGALGRLVEDLDRIGIGAARMRQALPRTGAATLTAWLDDRAALQRAAGQWRGAVRHFLVRLGPSEVRQAIAEWLDWLPAGEREYWARQTTAGSGDSLTFLALSLDADGRPIRVVNTDPATAMFLDGTRLRGERLLSWDEVRREVDVIMRPFPVGLFIDRLGPVTANDVYASPAVRDSFRRDPYHGPRVVWGREVNLFLLGLATHLATARAGGGPAVPAADVAALETALRRTMAAVDASGLGNAELWSYAIEGGRLQPQRYGSTSDAQLWSTTDLAVAYALWRAGQR